MIELQQRKNKNLCNYRLRDQCLFKLLPPILLEWLVLAAKGWALDIDGASPVVLSLDSGRAMVCARHIETGYAIKSDGGGQMGQDCYGSNHNEPDW